MNETFYVERSTGYVTIEIKETASTMYAEASVYDGRYGSPDYLQTPEAVERFPTVAAAKAWATEHAQAFLEEADAP